MQITKITPDENITILAGNLIDGNGGDAMKNTVIEVAKGDITALVKEADISTYRTKEGLLLDWSEYTVLPGLIDCHVHMALDGEDLWQAIEGWDNVEQVRARVAGYRKAFLENGVLLVRDGGDRAGIGISAVNWSWAEPGPYIIAAGEAIYRKGRYGSFLGPGISNLADAQREINKLADWGVGLIKVAMSGLVSFKEYGAVGAPQFTLEEMTQIVKMAHQANLPVMVHASGQEAVDIAVRSNADSIEHGYFIGSDTIKLMAEMGTAWVPTLAPLGNLVESGRVYEGASVDVIRRSYELQLQRINEAVEAGVLLGVGTDAGANQVYHGSSYHQELAHYRKADLSPARIIQAATAHSARVVECEQMLGVVEPGKIPFLIAVQGNPLADLADLRKVEAVLI